jgi:hypothetical protein
MWRAAAHDDVEAQLQHERKNLATRNAGACRRRAWRAGTAFALLNRTGAADTCSKEAVGRSVVDVEHDRTRTGVAAAVVGSGGARIRACETETCLDLSHCPVEKTVGRRRGGGHRG